MSKIAVDKKYLFGIVTGIVTKITEEKHFLSATATTATPYMSSAKNCGGGPLFEKF
jgi:hypothetical protein